MQLGNIGATASGKAGVEVSSAEGFAPVAERDLDGSRSFGPVSVGTNGRASIGIGGSVGVSVGAEVETEVSVDFSKEDNSGTDGI